jgi:hypothetical protein
MKSGRGLQPVLTGKWQQTRRLDLIVPKKRFMLQGLGHGNMDILAHKQMQSKI